MRKLVAALSVSGMLIVSSASWALPMPGPKTYSAKPGVHYKPLPGPKTYAAPTAQAIDRRK